MRKVSYRDVSFHRIGDTTTRRTLFTDSKTGRQLAVLTEQIVCEDFIRGSGLPFSFDIVLNEKGYRNTLSLPVEGKNGITLANVSWPIAEQIARREASLLGKVLNRLDPAFHNARRRARDK